jgi:putative transposase
MARRPREVSPIRFYRVYSRGTGGLAYFEDDEDCLACLDSIGAAATRHNLRIHGHCLMRTHYHLAVQATHADLVDGMHRVGGDLARRLNRRRDRFGHVVAGRFGSSALATHDSVIRVAAYIALNPVAAGVIDDPLAYRWSSHAAIAGVEEPPAWLDTDLIRRLFDGRYRAAIAREAAEIVRLRRRDSA